MFELPDIKKFDRVQPFLAAFIETNQLKGDFTFRKFAAEIGWPASLLVDLIARRRPFSIARAAEFARFFSLNGPDSERLIYLCMRDVDGESLNQFVDSYFETEGNELAIPLPQDTAAPFFISPEMMGDFATMALHNFLLWTGGHTTEEEIVTLMGLIPELADAKSVHARLEKLREAGIISGELPAVRIEKRDLACRGMKLADMLTSLEFIKTVADLPWRQSAWNQGNVIFPKSKHQELMQRIVQLRTWILRTAMMTANDSSIVPRQDCLPLQIQLGFSHLVNLSNLGLELKTTANAENELVPK